ncbi:MAG: hypothetical protein JWP91_171 [Fibrobacteres bacterium]|nr:hypothetical protein [Fibrobacterota bacterium]
MPIYESTDNGFREVTHLLPSESPTQPGAKADFASLTGIVDEGRAVSARWERERMPVEFESPAHPISARIAESFRSKIIRLFQAEDAPADQKPQPGAFH